MTSNDSNFKLLDYLRKSIKVTWTVIPKSLIFHCGLPVIHFTITITPFIKTVTEWVEYHDRFLWVKIRIFVAERFIEDFIVNICIEQRRNSSFFQFAEHLFTIKVGVCVKETHAEVFWPLAWSEHEEKQSYDDKIIELLDHVLIWIKIIISLIKGWNQAINY